MSIQMKGIVRGANEGEDLWVLGGLYSYKGTPDETGAYLACEVQAPDGFGIPVHFHEDEEEAFYVARGEVTIVIDGAEHRLAAGGFAFAPHGTNHAFRFDTPDSALLLLISPGHKHERMFRAMGEPATDHRLPDGPGKLGPAELGPIGDQWGTHIVGPPPTR